MNSWLPEECRNRIKTIFLEKCSEVEKCMILNRNLEELPQSTSDDFFSILDAKQSMDTSDRSTNSSYLGSSSLS
jgi:hypothetical protein